jgi:ethanolamine utilization protein EutN
MRTGKVVKSIVASKRLWDTPNGALLVVELDPPPAPGKKPPPGEQLIAFDTLGCGNGEPVLVATGSAVTAWFAGKPPPIDALIIASFG